MLFRSRTLSLFLKVVYSVEEETLLLKIICILFLEEQMCDRGCGKVLKEFKLV